jgi:hypothetical protein
MSRSSWFIIRKFSWNVLRLIEFYICNADPLNHIRTYVIYFQVHVVIKESVDSLETHLVYDTVS